MKPIDQLAQADAAKKLWKGLLPSFEVPGDEQFLLWADVHSPELISLGINRASRKARKMAEARTPMNTNDVARYASSVMNNEAKGLRRFETGITPKMPHPVSVPHADDENRWNR